MRSVHPLLPGLVLVTAALAAGCNASTSDDAAGSSQARLIVSSAGQGTATLHVTAVEDATEDVALDQSITVQAGDTTAVALSLPATGYTFAVEVLGAGDAKIGGSSAHVDLTEGVTTQITLAAQLQGDSDTAQVQIGVDAAPTIEGVHVWVDASDSVQIHLDASDSGGGALSFFWSGAGLDAAVQGSSTLAIPRSALTASSMIHVVVQDNQGATSSADIAVSAEGDVQGAMFTTATPSACLDAQTQCDATCVSALQLGGTVSLDTSCLAACSLALAQCEAPRV